MTPEEKTKAENAVKYYFSKALVLQKEMELLSIERDGLFDISAKLNNFLKTNLQPAAEEDLRFDDLFWKCSDQSTRFHGAGMTVGEIFNEKAKQAVEMQQEIKRNLEILGIDTSEIALNENHNLDDIITTFEDSIN